MNYQSNALWPVGVCYSVFGDNTSTDTHSTRGQAQGVCDGLEREGFGGERKFFPICTWVSDGQQPPRNPYLKYKEDEFVSNDKNITIRIWNDMLEEGVPDGHILDLARKHLISLNNLDPKTDGKEKAIEETELFITELKQKRLDSLGK
jgi:hypothetical protein